MATSSDLDDYLILAFDAALQLAINKRINPDEIITYSAWFYQYFSNNEKKIN